LRVRDDGFGILEAVVALTIIFMLIVTLLRTFDTTVSIVSQTSRRSAATALASELIERSRSLEWEHMGLTANANGADCPDDVGCTTLPPSIKDQISINGAGNYAFDGEEIVFANGATFDPFLSFSEVVTRGGANYTRYLFVTSIRDDQTDVSTESARRILAVVRWEAPNGLPEEIRLATIVTEFTEPSQPYIHGEIDFDGGTVTVRGSDAHCGGDPACGAYAPGTGSWAGALVQRDEFTANLFAADGFVSATSDYVSNGISRANGASAEVRKAGVDGLLNTADDDLSAVDESQVLVVVDDDASSLPDRNEPYVAPVSPATFDASGTPPYDLLIADLQDDADLDLLSDPERDNGSVQSEAWVEHDTDPGADVVDGLPYAALDFDTAETTRIGFLEYAEPNARVYYAGLLGSSLGRGHYEFTLARFGDDAFDPAVNHDGSVDRFDDTSGNRQVHADATWTAERLYLLADTIQTEQPSRGDFEGWLMADLPTLATSASVQAGEAAGTTPGITVGTDLKVYFWDAAAAKYELAFSGYSAMACDTSTTISFADVAVIGGPQTYTTSSSGHPRVRFEVDGEFTVRKFCAAYDLDALGNVAGSYVQSQGFLTGTMTYKATDELVEAAIGDGVLFDLELDFDAGGVDATTLFYDPNA
jgi:hypothetical protein